MKISTSKIAFDVLSKPADPEKVQVGLEKECSFDYC